MYDIMATHHIYTIRYVYELDISCLFSILTTLPDICGMLHLLIRSQVADKRSNVTIKIKDFQIKSIQKKVSRIGGNSVECNGD